MQLPRRNSTKGTTGKPQWHAHNPNRVMAVTHHGADNAASPAMKHPPPPS